MVFDDTATYTNLSWYTCHMMLNRYQSFQIFLDDMLRFLKLKIFKARTVAPKGTKRSYKTPTFEFFGSYSTSYFFLLACCDHCYAGAFRMSVLCIRLKSKYSSNP